MDLGWIAFGGLTVFDFLVVAAWRPFFTAYMGEKGKRLATKEDIEHVPGRGPVGDQRDGNNQGFDLWRSLATASNMDSEA